MSKKSKSNVKAQTKTVYLVASGDLRASANQVCEKAQAELEEKSAVVEEEQRKVEAGRHRLECEVERHGRRRGFAIAGACREQQHGKGQEMVESRGVRAH